MDLYLWYYIAARVYATALYHKPIELEPSVPAAKVQITLWY